MTTLFRRSDSLIRVQARVTGPVAVVRVLLALDTGSSWTAIDPRALSIAGCRVDGAQGNASIVTPSGTTTAAMVEVLRLSAVGATFAPFVVLAHAFPREAGIQGLLGLDFLRRGRLQIDFPKGELEFLAG